MVRSEPRAAFDWRLGGLFVLAASFVGFVAREQFLTGDPTLYLGLARSLAAGDGYTFMGRAHTFYPPGLPGLIAPFVWLFGGAPIVGQVVVALTAPLALAAVVLLARPRGRAWAVAVGILVVFGFPFFNFATAGVRSEIPYLAASALALALLFGPSRSGAAVAVAVAMLTAAAILLRTVGVALAMALLVSWIQRRWQGRPWEALDRTLLVAGIVGVVTMAAWSWWGSIHEGPSYLAQLRLASPHQPDLGDAGWLGLVERLPRNFLFRATGLGQLLLNVPWLTPVWTSPVVLPLILLAGVGLAHELRSANPAMAWYVLGYGGILLIWPFAEGVRFLVPLLPMVALLAGRGASLVGPWVRDRAASRADSRRLAMVCAGLAALAAVDAATGVPSRQAALGAVVWGSAAVVVLLRSRLPASRPVRWDSTRLLGAALALYALIGLVRIVPAALENVRGIDRSANRELAPAMAWLAANADGGAIVMAELASAVSFHTGLAAVDFPKTADVGRLVAALGSGGVHFLLVSDPRPSPYYRPTETERLALLSRELGERLTLAHRFPSGAIYRVGSR